MTIPKSIRQQLGIRKGSKIDVAIVKDHIELYVTDSIADVPQSGFAMLKSKCKPVPCDFDPADLLNNDRA